jgi:hypothetical protein
MRVGKELRFVRIDLRDFLEVVIFLFEFLVGLGKRVCLFFRVFLHLRLEIVVVFAHGSPHRLICSS